MPRRATKFDPVATAESKAARRAEREAALEAKRRELREGPDLTLTRAATRALEKAERYVVTAAMNNVPVDANVFGALRRCAEERDARLLVVPIRYRNPTTPGEYTLRGAGWWWPKEVEPFLVGSPVQLHRYLWLFGDVRVGATAENPLSGLDPFGSGASAIFGHSQLAMTTIATPQLELPKILHTTGTTSVARYSESKAGAKAAFHHSLGGLYVEADGDAFHLRQLCTDSQGGFYDVDRYFHAKGSKRADPAEALVLGDWHEWFTDPAVAAATLGFARRGDGRFVGVPGSLATATRARRWVFHDLVDAYAISHHHRRDPILRAVKRAAGRSDLRAELESVVEFLRRCVPRGVEAVVVPSNHHDHILRWLREADWRDDPENAELYLELALDVLRASRFGAGGVEEPDPFARYVERALGAKARVRFLGADAPFRVGGVELGLHGHLGPNGARGTARNLSMIGTRTMIGHTHSPGIVRGCWVVGTSSHLRREYTRGPSSWLNTHGLVWPNGKRQLVSVIGGRWRKG